MVKVRCLLGRGDKLPRESPPRRFAGRERTRDLASDSQNSYQKWRATDAGLSAVGQEMRIVLNFFLYEYNVVIESMERIFFSTSEE